MSQTSLGLYLSKYVETRTHSYCRRLRLRSIEEKKSQPLVCVTCLVCSSSQVLDKKPLVNTIKIFSTDSKHTLKITNDGQNIDQEKYIQYILHKYNNHINIKKYQHIYTIYCGVSQKVSLLYLVVKYPRKFRTYSFHICVPLIFPCSVSMYIYVF